MDPAQEQLIRDSYAAFARGDLDAALAAFAPEATFTNPDYAIDSGVRAGLEQVRAGFQTLHEQFEYDAIELEEIREGPQGVVVTAHMKGHGRSSGAPLEGHFFHVFRLRGEQVVDFAWFNNLDEARQAAGL